MIAFQKILFPVHLSEMSSKVAPYVATMARKFEAKIHLLHVARNFDYYVDVYVAEDSTTGFKKTVSNFQTELLRVAKNRLMAFQKEHFADFPEIGTQVASGKIEEEILRVADAEEVDLIIMGAHTRPFIDTIVFGSVAKKVVEGARVPVMVVRESDIAHTQ
jgi:nucleotide-binding universal stress UspA family protein